MNDAPVITSDGGGATAALNVAENTTAVTTVLQHRCGDRDTVTYSIAGGDDAALFSIVGASGELTSRRHPISKRLWIPISTTATK
ncbi:MAG: cadherin repeat domain-containing protein [Pseudomonadales bacterium]